MSRGTEVTEKALRGVVETIDRTAQSAFSRIAMIAEFALISLEQPSADGVHQSRNELMAVAFEAIRDLAFDSEACITCSAFDVGCGYSDAAAWRRTTARSAAEAAKPAAAGVSS